MLKQFKCEKCDCNRDFIEKDGIFICQTCGTEYSLKYAVNKTIQNLTTEIFGILYESIKPDIDDGSEIANCLWITLKEVLDSNYEEASNLCSEAVELNENDYRAWLLKGLVLYCQIGYAGFERSNYTPDMIDSEGGNQVSDYTEAGFSEKGIIGFQSALFFMGFDKVIQCFVTAIQVAPKETKDTIETVCYQLSEAEAAAFRLHMLETLVEYPVGDNDSSYRSAYVSLIERPLAILVAAHGLPNELGILEDPREDTETKSHRDWDWEFSLKQAEYNAGIEIWKRALEQYSTDHDGHPSNEALLRVSFSLLTAIATIRFSAAFGKDFEDMSMEELNFALKANKKAVDIFHEIKNLKSYKATYKDGIMTYTSDKTFDDFDLYDSNISDLQVEIKKLGTEIERRSQ